MTLWVDVEDIFHFATLGARPSGIQRVSFELCAALRELPEVTVRFVRNAPGASYYREVSWEELRNLYQQMTHSPTPVASPASWRRRLLRRMPHELQDSLRLAVGAQKTALAAGWSFLRRLARPLRIRTLLRSADILEGAPPVPLKHLGIPTVSGDSLCVFGAPWHVDYASRMKCVRAAGLNFVLLVHDLIPIVRPEFVMAKIKEEFEPWYRACLPFADHVFTVSRATAGDLESWARRTNLRLRGPVTPIRLGTGLSGVRSMIDAKAELPAGLRPGAYVLLVSTLEVRKNHLLAFRVWRRLLQTMPRDDVPSLVFAGHPGWTSEDLLNEIENSGHLDGKLILVLDPDDDALANLYRQCLFTLFPSHYEGWGLPVAESLAFGKVCIASSASSIPEIAPAFCLFFDPESITQASAVVRYAIEHPNIISCIEARIRAEHIPANWTEAAQAIAQRLV